MEVDQFHRQQEPCLGPISSIERIESLDVLRGLAILGILVMNIQSFGLVEAMYWNPTAIAPLSGLNYAYWLVSHLFFNMKFITLFSLLFGAGIVLMSERCTKTGRNAAIIHYRRMFFLGIAGLIHAYCFWYGDILFTYAVCGSIVYIFRRLPVVWLYLLGFLTILIPCALMSLSGWAIMNFSKDVIPDIESALSPGPEAVAAEIAAYRGSWLEQLAYRIPSALSIQTYALIFDLGWRSVGIMLLGMALYKQGILSTLGKTRTYWVFLSVAVFIGLPLVYGGVLYNEYIAWNAVASKFIGSQFNYWGSIFVALGWLSAIMLLCKYNLLRPVRKALSNIGRIALTNYLGQTLICTSLFYGHGLGLFGSLSLSQLFLVVLGVWTFQFIFSAIWLKHFRYGPFEWVWRSATYWHIPT